MANMHRPPRTKLDFEFHLAEHCNLNCAGCDHFSPLAPKLFPDFDAVCRDLRRLRELFGAEGVGRIHLLGGEPLLNPKVEDYIRAVRDLFPDNRLELVTNGLLLPKMPESFWDTCRKCSVIIRPTKYPIALDYDRLERCAAEHGVRFRYYNAEPIKTLYKLHLDTSGSQDPKASYCSCGMSNMCLMLKNGRIYTCPVIPNVDHFNRFFDGDFRVTDEDSIDIYGVSSGAEILEFVSHSVPFCRYCDTSNKEYGLPWHLSDRTTDEWI